MINRGVPDRPYRPRRRHRGRGMGGTPHGDSLSAFVPVRSDGAGRASAPNGPAERRTWARAARLDLSIGHFGT